MVLLIGSTRCGPKSIGLGTYLKKKKTVKLSDTTGTLQWL